MPNTWINRLVVRGPRADVLAFAKAARERPAPTSRGSRPRTSSENVSSARSRAGTRPGALKPQIGRQDGHWWAKEILLMERAKKLLLA